MFSTKNLDSRQQAILQSTEHILGGKSIGEGNVFSNMIRHGSSIVLGCGSHKARNRVILLNTTISDGGWNMRTTVRKDAESCVCSLIYRGFGVTFTDGKVLSYEPKSYDLDRDENGLSPTSMIIDAPFSEVHIEEHYFNTQLENPGVYKKDHISMIQAMVPGMQRVLAFRSRMFHHVRNTSKIAIEIEK